MSAAAAGAPALTLVSHALCPYVQRVAIVLREKGLAFERRTIDLAHKPDWFLALSPLGKTPVLQVRGQSLFESAVICEYLDEVAMPALHPQDPLQRARHRAWMEFGSTVLNTIGAFYAAPDEAALRARAQELRGRFVQLEEALGAFSGAGPYFAGPDFGMVDVVFGPVFRYFDVIDTLPGVDGLGLWQGLPRVLRWRTALAARASVQQAVSADYAEGLRVFLRARGSALSRRMDAVTA
ncbi:glutathione S-transferase family protein [Acidovorax sp. sif1233]|uniref:glutathione S-transferase family protein n=1 Tax=Acidovorax sp. sif1233 TaxID=2854792 RepID=UPI001C436E65|nr:glutathione S-transferase family protein [Acidovorax sp. sif1233]